MRAIDQLTDSDREQFAELREEIQAKGHLQGQRVSTKVCVVTAHALHTHLARRDLLLRAIVEASGADFRGYKGADARPRKRVLLINDALKTDEVIDLIAALEVG